jgi:hypothetical protein
VICALKQAGTWNIVLTPNYNADHRNHFHVDLTDGANTIKREAAAESWQSLVTTDSGDVAAAP